MKTENEAAAWFRAEFASFIRSGYQIHAQSRAWTQAARDLRARRADSLYTEAAHRGLTKEDIVRIKEEVRVELGKEH